MLIADILRSKGQDVIKVRPEEASYWRCGSLPNTASAHWW